MGQLRIALTISGAVALGAYEGGALAALLLGVQEFYQDPPAEDGRSQPRIDDTTVCIDAIGGASAGSMTAVLAIRALRAGLDPITLMYRVWVSEPSLAKLEQGAVLRAPLSLDAVRQDIVGLLRPTEEAAWRDPAHKRYLQPNPIKLVMSLGCLQGLDYKIKSLRYTTPVEATTYLDLSTFSFDLDEWPDPTAQAVLDRYLTPEGASVVDVALASGANELGFPPMLLDRDSQSLIKQYKANGLAHPSPHYWYTDGGTIDNEPLGHTMDLVNELDANLGAENGRLHILIHPHPDAADTSGRWTNPDPDGQPSWTATFARAYPMIRSQHLFDDLRRMEKTNTHLQWVDRLVTELTPRLQALEAKDPNTYREWQAGLREVLQEIAEAKRGFPGHISKAAEAAPTDSAAVLMGKILRAISDTAGKNLTRVEVISPLLVVQAIRAANEAAGKPDSDLPSVNDLLAGEFLSSFGGFLDQNLRRSDFQLGFASVLEWMERIDGRAKAREQPTDVTEALLCRFVERALPVVKREFTSLVKTMDNLDCAADSHATATDTTTNASTPAGRPNPPLWDLWGKTTLGSLPLGGKLAALGLATRIVRVVVNDLVHPRSAAPAARPARVRPSVAVPALVTMAAISMALWRRKTALRSRVR